MASSTSRRRGRASPGTGGSGNETPPLSVGSTADTATEEAVPIESLFNYSHIDGLSWTGPWCRPWRWRVSVGRHLCDWRYLVLLLYAPVGMLLLIARLPVLLVSALLLSVLPRPLDSWLFDGILMRILPIMGFRSRVRLENLVQARKSPAPLVVASNHCTAFDILPFLARFHAHVLLDKRFYEANIIVAQFLRVVGAIPVSFGAEPEERAALRETIRAHVDDARHPLLFFPEGWDTNGRRGLLMFNKFLFSLGHRVVPVVLKVSTPLPFCNTGMLGSSAIRELLWFFFYPWSTFELTTLPADMLREGEDAVAFARRTQERIAVELGVAATQWRKRDALQHRLTLLQ